MQSGMVLLFVYNIDRGNLSAMTDYHQSLSSAKSPRCNLFALIFSPVGMKKAWKRFINDISIPSRFLYYDEYQQESGEQKPVLPAVYVQSGTSFHALITAEEINRIGSTDALIVLVTQRLKQFMK
jgi:hypothetical protein